MLDHTTLTLPDCPPLVASLLGLDTPMTSADSIGVLIQLAGVNGRGHGHGGSLLVVPHGSHFGGEPIVGLTPSALLPPYPELADLIREESK